MNLVLRLFLSASPLLMLLQQEPQSSPRDRPVLANGPQGAGAAFADLDRDGQMDLLLAQQTNQAQGLNWLYRYQLGGGPGDGLGMSLTALDPALRAQLSLPEKQGLFVAGVIPGGPADRAGIQPHDILVALQDHPLAEPDDLPEQLKQIADKPAVLKVIRAGKPTELRVKAQTTVTLAPAANEPPKLYLGVQTTPADATLRAHLDLPSEGALVINEVIAGSPAEKAGLKSGDILLKLNNHPLPDPETLAGVIQSSDGKPTELTFLRGGKPQHATFTPEPRPQTESAVGTTEQVWHAGLFANPPSRAMTYYRTPLTQGNAPWISQVQPYLTGNQLFRSQLAAPTPAQGPDRIDALAKQVEDLRKAVQDLNGAIRKLDK